MSIASLNLAVALPLFAGLLCALPLFILLRALWRNRRLRLRLRRLLDRRWQPVFLTRHDPGRRG